MLLASPDLRSRVAGTLRPLLTPPFGFVGRNPTQSVMALASATASTSAYDGLLGSTAGHLTLRVRGSTYDGQMLRVNEPKCLIGSDSSCTVRLGSKAVDALHCLILRGHRETVVRRWSPNTRLNGNSFVDAKLAVGDRLAVGPVELEVVEDIRGDEPASTSAPADDDSDSLPAHDGGLSDHDAQSSRAAAQEELDRLREQHERDRDEWEQARSRLTSDADKLQREVVQLEGESGRVGREVARLEGEIDGLRQQIAERETEASRLREQVAHSESEVDCFRQQIADREREADRLRQQVDGQSDHFRHEAAAQNERLAQERCELDSQKQRLDHERQQLASEKEQLDRDRKQLADHDERLIRKRRELDAEKELIARERQETAGQIEQLAKGRHHLAERDELLVRQRQELAAQSQRHALEREELAVRKDRLAREAETLAVEKKRLAQDAEELAAQRDRLDHELATTPAADVDHPGAMPPVADRPAAAAQSDPADDSSSRPGSHEESKSTTNPETGITFELLPTGPPVSASDVLARLGQASALLNESIDDPVGGKLVDAPAADEPKVDRGAVPTITDSGRKSPDDVARLPKKQPAADLPPVDDSQQVPPEATAGTASKPAGLANGHEPEESIEDYMSRLMQRLRGDDEKKSPTPQPGDKRNAETASSASPSAPASTPVSTTGRPTKPRVRAPEMTANLQAMRELANESARSAIKHSSKRKAGIAYGAIAVGLAAAVCGAVLSWVSPEAHSVGFWGAITNFAVAVLCVGYIITQRRRVSAIRSKMLRNDRIKGVVGQVEGKDAEHTAT